MPELHARLLPVAISRPSGEQVGEARLWLAGVNDGAWTGWLRIADLPSRPTPGPYTFAAADGLAGDFEISATPTTRVFETDLLAIHGVGALRLPSDADEPALPRPASLPSQTRL